MGALTYLVMELVWAGPVIALQWLIAGRLLRARWRVLAAGVAIPTIYLGAADALAIRVGIWTLDPERTLGISIGPLPLEEGLFFLLTNLMVTQGILMMTDAGSLTVPGRATGSNGERPGVGDS